MVPTLTTCVLFAMDILSYVLRVSSQMDEENPKMGLHKASEEVLARRPSVYFFFQFVPADMQTIFSMKGLPQRGAARTPQASASTAASTTSAVRMLTIFFM